VFYSSRWALAHISSSFEASHGRDSELYVINFATRNNNHFNLQERQTFGQNYGYNPFRSMFTVRKFLQLSLCVTG